MDTEIACQSVEAKILFLSIYICKEGIEWLENI